MKTVNKTALANLRQNRGRNLLSGIAIILTTLLIFLVLTVGYGMISVQFAAVNEYYPTFHAMYRQVSQENAEALKAHKDIEKLGLREDFGQVIQEDMTILMISMDKEALELNKMELTQGQFPKEKKEVAVSKEMLEKMGIQADIGDEVTLPFQLYEDGGMGYAKEDTFRISGFLKTAKQEGENLSYVTLHPMEYMEQMIPESEREYRVVLRLAETQKMTSDDIEERVKEIGADFGVVEENVVENTEYLTANYVDPAFVTGMVMVALVVVLAGVLTIYSIYYVSMIPKVQEYGKLKALGATKKQIRQMVLREGLLVTGLLVGSILAKPILQMFLYQTQEASGNEGLTGAAIRCLENGEVPILHWWMYLLAIAAVLVTTYLALLKPMKMAAKISPVEAMRYQGGQKEKQKERKGYQSLNVVRLTKANLLRNKKRFIVTIIALGSVGVLFIAVATVLSCADPKEISRQEMESDYQIEVESWSGDKMNPDREWSNLMKENPLDETFVEELRKVPGVTEVKTKDFLSGSLPELDPEDEIGGADVAGLDESYAKELEKNEIDGSVTYKELTKGKKIVINETVLHWFPELKPGEMLKVRWETGEGTIEKEFEIGAVVGREFDTITRCSLILPKSVLEDLTSYNLTDICEITIDPKHKEEAYQALDAMTKSSPYLGSKKYDDVREQWEKTMNIMQVGGYGFLIILGGIGIMNLINTMITSIYTRKRELGMLQAIGLSEKQMIRMMQLEGIFYTAGTLVISLGIGSLAGYGVFLYAKADGMFHITRFHYPIIPALVLALAVLAIQLLLTYGISRSFRKMSLIDRIRYSE